MYNSVAVLIETHSSDTYHTLTAGRLYLAHTTLTHRYFTVGSKSATLDQKYTKILVYVHLVVVGMTRVTEVQSREYIRWAHVPYREDEYKIEWIRK